MAASMRAPRPGWFPVVALLAVVWNAIGVSMYLSSVGVFGDPMTGLSEGQRAAAESIPGWITGAFAIGTFAGLAGSLALLFHRSLAVPLLLVSLVALLLLEGWIIFFSGAVDEFGLAVPITVVAGAVLLAWLATHARSRGWLS